MKDWFGDILTNPETMASAMILLTLSVAALCVLLEPLFLKLFSALLFRTGLGYLRCLLTTVFCMLIVFVLCFTVTIVGPAVDATWSLSGSFIIRAAVYSKHLTDRDSGTPLGFWRGLILALGVAILWAGVIAGVFFVGQEIFERIT